MAGGTAIVYTTILSFSVGYPILASLVLQGWAFLFLATSSFSPLDDLRSGVPYEPDYFRFADDLGVGGDKRVCEDSSRVACEKTGARLLHSSPFHSGTRVQIPSGTPRFQGPDRRHG